MQNKSNIAAIITSIAALIAAGGTFYNNKETSKDSDLMIQTLYVINTTISDRMSKMNERIAILEISCNKSAGAIKLECSKDTDCKDGTKCANGVCVNLAMSVSPAQPAPSDDIKFGKFTLPSYDKLQSKVQSSGKPLKKADFFKDE